MPHLTGKIALVTGASRGIGRATALELARCGAHVIAHYSSSEGHAKSLQQEIAQAVGSAEIVAADLAVPDGPHRLAAEVRRLTGDTLDVVVSNAGLLNRSNLPNETVEGFDRQMAVNARAPFFLVQQLDTALRDGGSIVMLSSITATRDAGFPSYGATKGAISSLVVSLAAYFGPRAIRVNGVAPGGIATDLTEGIRHPEAQESMKRIQALRRIGQPDDIASVISFLASDEARWITGAILPTDGGAKL